MVLINTFVIIISLIEVYCLKKSYCAESKVYFIHSKVIHAHTMWLNVMKWMFHRWRLIWYTCYYHNQTSFSSIVILSKATYPHVFTCTEKYDGSHQCNRNWLILSRTRVHSCFGWDLYFSVSSFLWSVLYCCLGFRRFSLM